MAANSSSFRLVTLGRSDLRGPDGNPIQSVLQQPKRFALLVHLALVGPAAYRRRDSVLGVLWPELDDEHARGALKQALHYLRRSLGSDAIVSRGADEVGVSHDRVWCDAVAFDSELATGGYQQALKLYGGDLLPGYFLRGEGEWEAWLEAERTRLRRRATNAAWLLAEEEARRGNSAASIAAAHRAAELDDGGEVAARRLIEVLVRGGDRAGAKRAYDNLVSHLADEYGVGPSPETEQLATAMRAAAGSNVKIPTHSSERASHGETAEPLAGADHSVTIRKGGLGDAFGKRMRPAWTLIKFRGPAVLLTCAVLAVVGAFYRESRAPARLPDLGSVPIEVVVYPFAHLGESDSLAFLTQAIPAALLDELLETHGIQVRSSSNNLNGGSGVSQPGVASIGVHGSVIASADRIRVLVRILDPASGRVLEVEALGAHEGLLWLSGKRVSQAGPSYAAAVVSGILALLREQQSFANLEHVRRLLRAYSTVRRDVRLMLGGDHG